MSRTLTSARVRHGTHVTALYSTALSRLDSRQQLRPPPLSPTPQVPMYSTAKASSVGELHSELIARARDYSAVSRDRVTFAGMHHIRGTQPHPRFAPIQRRCLRSAAPSAAS
eukprot:5191274-Prymnesium_polylepis.1